MWSPNLRYGSKERNFYILYVCGLKKHLNIFTYLQILYTRGFQITATQNKCEHVRKPAKLLVGHILISLLAMCVCISLDYSGDISVFLCMPVPLISMPFPSCQLENAYSFFKANLKPQFLTISTPHPPPLPSWYFLQVQAVDFALPCFPSSAMGTNITLTSSSP